MGTATLVIVLIGQSLVVASQGVDFWRNLHHHTTRPLYRHVLKPIAKELKK
jgi:hypothetical protein